jgi:Fe2+ transport system protein FeoA
MGQKSRIVSIAGSCREKKKQTELGCTKSEFEVLTISLVKLLKLGHSPTGILAIFFFPEYSLIG